MKARPDGFIPCVNICWLIFPSIEQDIIHNVLFVG